MCPPGVISGRNLSRVSPPESVLFDIDWQFDMFSEGLFGCCFWLIWFPVCPPGGSCVWNLWHFDICVLSVVNLVPCVSTRWQFGIKNLLRLRQPWDDHFNIGWQFDMFSQALKVLMPISHVIKQEERLFLEAVQHLCTVFFCYQWRGLSQTETDKRLKNMI